MNSDIELNITFKTPTKIPKVYFNSIIECYYKNIFTFGLNFIFKSDLAQFECYRHFTIIYVDELSTSS
jgi:hypothetical protein